MGKFLLFNNSCTTEKALHLSIEDRGLLFGDGVFTTIRLKDGVLENYQKHLARLRENSLSLQISPPKISEDKLEELIHKNQALSGTWRLKIMITGGAASHLDLQERDAGHLIVTLSESHQKLFAPYHLTLFPDPVSRPTAHIKSLAYLDRLWIKDFAVKRGVHDALTQTESGALLETAFSNIFWVRENAIYTPSFSLPLLKGTYLTSVLQESGTANEVVCSLEEIPTDAHLYVCNAMTGIQPVDQIDYHTFQRNDTLHQMLQQSAEKNIHQDSLVF